MTTRSVDNYLDSGELMSVRGDRLWSLCVRRSLFGLIVATGYATVACSASFAGSLGFVVTTWNMANYETRFIDECPQGLAKGYDELWWEVTPKAERSQLTNNGLRGRDSRYKFAIKRGRNGEDTCLVPNSVDPPPMLTVQGAAAYGANLDGNVDGAATPKTCPHQNFTAPDGTPGVDNQLYRALGCTFGFRSFGYIDANPNNNRKTQGLGMILIEIEGVDNARNDESVDIAFYRSIDVYPVDANSEFVPFGTYRIDSVAGRLRYGQKVKGKIVEGVLQTESGDIHLPYYGNYAYMDMFIKDMRLKLIVEPNGRRAKGEIVGYLDVEELNYYIGSLGTTHATTYTDCASIYSTTHQLADGYPDPKTGKCTAISAAYTINAVAAFISHPEKNSTSSQSPWKKIASWLKSERVQ